MSFLKRLFHKPILIAEPSRPAAVENQNLAGYAYARSATAYVSPYPFTNTAYTPPQPAPLPEPTPPPTTFTKPLCGQETKRSILR